jgi:hypothetical protein
MQKQKQLIDGLKNASTDSLIKAIQWTDEYIDELTIKLRKTKATKRAYEAESKRHKLGTS